jgi:hypothetical protein
MPSWDEFLGGYKAAVDLPVSAFWRELADANPGALIILSVRESPELWWESVSGTIFSPSLPDTSPGTPMADFRAMVTEMWNTRVGTVDVRDKEATISAYLRHNDTVRAQAQPERLLEWQAADGWAPLAAALGVPAPDEPFPHINTRTQFHVPEFGPIQP